MKIAIFGLGLIGGSIGRATLKKTSHEVFGTDLVKENIIKAKLLNAINGKLSDEILSDCDLVILSAYPDASIKIMQDILPKLKKGATVIDTCGTKRKIVSAMKVLKDKYPDVDFLGVHPMAGREFSGISHATQGLFENAYVILTPFYSDIRLLTKVRNFFVELGAAGVEVASAEKHDTMISYTSQLAHVLSSCYIKNELSSSYTGFSAGSFRDMTRVAKLNPTMWTELCIENRDNLSEQIQDLIDNLEKFKSALDDNDEERLFRLFEEGTIKKARADELMKERKKNERS